MGKTLSKSRKKTVRHMLTVNRRVLRIDPTRTGTLRRQLVRELRRRFARLKLKVVDLLLKEDALGLQAAQRVRAGFGQAARGLLVGVGKPRAPVANAFCPTGPGGGVDPGCSPGGANHAERAEKATAGIKNKAARELARKAYEDALSYGDTVPEIETYSFKGKVTAMYSQSNDKIFLSSKVNSKSQEVFEEQVSKGWWSQSNPVLHELGHKAHADAAGEFYDTAKNHQFSDAQKAAISSKVSKYAATNGLEFVAEVYAGARAGKKYDEEITRLFSAVTHGRVKL